MDFWLTVLTEISDSRLCLESDFHSSHAVMCLPRRTQGLNPPGLSYEEDADGFTKNVSRKTMRVPNAWRLLSAARLSCGTA